MDECANGKKGRGHTTIKYKEQWLNNIRYEGECKIKWEEEGKGGGVIAEVPRRRILVIRGGVGSTNGIS